MRFTRRAGLCVSLVLLGLFACGQDVAPSPERVDSVGASLVAAAEQYKGATLPNKQLILTFDDGPGPMSVTGELSTWLKGRPTPIRATFFVNGACIAATSLPNNSCGTPVTDAASVLAKVTSDGHLLANHTTTHRDITGVPAGQRVQELAETDTGIAPFVPWNRFLFRAPFGNWSTPVFTTLSSSAMSKYVGPVYWNAGGGPTSASMAADWECWENLSFTTKQCGDRYLTEIRALGNGIVLFHDAKGNTSNHVVNSGVGNTVDMVKYIVPILEGEGYTFKALWEDPEIAAALPTCDSSCGTCSGPAANQCTTCPSGKFVNAGSCTPCRACGAGTFASAACTGAADTVCTACTVCGSGSVTSSACSPTADTVCAPCTGSSCSDGGPPASDAGSSGNPPSSSGNPPSGTSGGVIASGTSGGAPKGDAPAAETGCRTSSGRSSAPDFTVVSLAAVALVARVRSRRRRR